MKSNGDGTARIEVKGSGTSGAVDAYQLLPTPQHSAAKQEAEADMEAEAEAK